VSFCAHGGEPGITVCLYEDRDKALAAKALIDKFACGGCCRGAPGHAVYELPAAEARPRRKALRT
jgi:hypothetical protein